MSIYKGLLFLDGFRVSAEDADDVATASSRPVASRPAASARRPRAPSNWRRSLRAIAAFAGVLAVEHPVGRCG